MKFAPLGSPLKSTQLCFKTTSFGEQTKKLWGYKNYYTFMMGMWFDHSCFEYTYGQPYMAALQQNVQTYTYFY